MDKLAWRCLSVVLRVLSSLSRACYWAKQLVRVNNLGEVRLTFRYRVNAKQE